MIKKVTKFKQDVDTLLKQAYDRYERSDYPSAMSFMIKAQALAPFDTEIGIEIALLFADMDLLEYQLKTLIKLQRQAENDAEVLKELIKCYFAMDMPERAFCCYKQALSRALIDEGNCEEFLDDEFLDFEFVDEEPERNIKLRDKRDNSKILQLSHKLLLSGDIVFAQQLMETISPDSYQYIDATNSLAVIALTLDDIPKAIDCSQKVLELDCDNVYAISHCVIAYDKLGDSASMGEYLDRLMSLELTKAGELSVAAFCLQRIHNSELSLHFLEKLIKLVPYSRDNLITCAIANSNCGRLDRARQLIVRAKKIYHDDVTVDYYAHQIIHANNQKTDLEIIPSIPEVVAAQWLTELEAFAKCANSKKEAPPIDEDLRRKILWAFQSADWRVQAMLGSFLVRFYPEWEEFVRDLLIDPYYDYRSKKEFLLAILLHCKNKRFALYTTDTYTTFSPKSPSSSYPEQMRRAYWQVYNTLAFVSVDFDAKLNRAFKEIVKKHAEMPVKIRIDARALSALLLYRVNLKSIFKTKTDCCEIFGSDLTDFEVYSEIFPEKTAQTKKESNA